MNTSPSRRVSSDSRIHLRTLRSRSSSARVQLVNDPLDLSDLRRSQPGILKSDQSVFARIGHRNQTVGLRELCLQRVIVRLRRSDQIFQKLSLIHI